MTEQGNERQLTFRGLLIGILGLLVITASSIYVSLRMGALPWPTVFVTVISLAILGRARNSNLREINVTHTIMSSGSMVAGGLAFTLPAIWILNPEAQLPIYRTMLIVLCGAALGIIFSSYFRKRLMTDKSLVFPMGVAAHDTLIAGTNRGKEPTKLFTSMGLSAVFTVLRDKLAIIPTYLTVYAGGTYIEPVSIWVSPMAAAIGALIDRFSALLWMGGCVVSYLGIPAIARVTGLLSDTATIGVFRQSLGIGIMLGSGLMVLVKALVASQRNHARKAAVKNLHEMFKMIVGAIVVCLVLAFGTGMGVVPAILLAVGACVVSLLSGMMTGQSGINPMEIFGILVMMVNAFFVDMSVEAKLITATVAAVSCGLTGDIMNDFKSGQMLGTSPKPQVIGEAIGGLVGAVVSVIVLYVLKSGMGPFGSVTLPAPQATAVASMIGGNYMIPVLVGGMVIGAIMVLFDIPAATFGLGIYLPTAITITVGFGTLVNLVLTKGGPSKSTTIESGLLGGEGITGVVIAIISMFS